MANWGQKVYPSDYAEIKALLKAEVGRRGKTEGTARGQSVGSMASYLSLIHISEPTRPY